MLKVAIIGCGKIADAHASQILRVPNCRIVGVCDREPLMAEQLYRRYPVDAYFTDLKELLHRVRPEVVHITTPPQGHFGIAELCLRAGCNVYVEKPFTLFAEQTEQLLTLADQQGLKVTVGHDDQFSPVARRMRELKQSGYLGDGAIHMESYYCYELGWSPYVRALLSDDSHWVRNLPGKLLHNIISHGIARIAEFMYSDSPKVIAHGFVSPFLRSKG
jgi:predicted dehydrogenase